MKIKIYIALALGVLSGYWFFLHHKDNNKIGYHIAILQSCSHPSLDEARKGFIETIRSNFSEDKIALSYCNGEGSASTIIALAQQMVSNKNIDMFYAIGSFSAHNLYALEKKRPILLAAVSDPIANGIPLNASNVAGVSDAVSPETPLYIINRVTPDAKKIGLLYSVSSLNDNEANKVTKNLEDNEKTVLPIIVQSEQDLIGILDTSLPKIDILLSLCDNVIASTAPFIAKKTIETKIPFITCFNDGSKKGALASCGTNYYEDGKLVAQYAIDIIKKEKKPYQYGITINKDTTIYVNQNTANKLQKTIQEDSKIVFL